LNRLNARYAVTGAMALIAYGEPRLTNDLDLIVEWPPSQAKAFQHAFLGRHLYVPDVETLTAEFTRPSGGHFNLVQAEFALRADVYCAGADRLIAWALADAKPITVDSLRVRVAPPEYVIVRKLQYAVDGASPKHLDDIRAVLRRSADALDLARIEREADQAGVGARWRTVLGGG
jgi:hypothetical protein